MVAITNIDEFRAYHRQKSKEFYEKAKGNGKAKEYLKRKKEKYDNDPEYKAKIKAYNKERYHTKKNALLKQQEELTTKEKCDIINLKLELI